MIVVLLGRLIVMACFLGCFQIFSAIVAAGVESKIKLLKPASSFVLNSPLSNFSGFIVDPVAGIKGRHISLSGARVETERFRGFMTGVFDPLNPGDLTLDGNRSFWGNLGLSLQASMLQEKIINLVAGLK